MAAVEADRLLAVFIFVGMRFLGTCWKLARKRKKDLLGHVVKKRVKAPFTMQHDTLC
jgi:hypothetical protein